MNEAMDLRWISIPFAAGVAAGSFLPWQSGIAALALTASLILFLLEGKNGNPWLPAAFLMAGVFCATVSTAYSSPAVSGWEPAVRAEEALRRVIEEIPFRDGESNALLEALLSGNRGKLERETVIAFRDAGASHILALSGLHLGVIHLVIRKTFIIFGNSIRAGLFRAVTISALAAFYTVMTGASPSTVRALFFIFLSEWSSVSPGRKGSPERSLLLALTLQLALSPSSIKSLSFQMSYLAMCGIIFLLPRLSAWYPAHEDGRPDPVRKIWEAAALSISCQAFTSPLAWIRFHTFPKYFLLTNLLALPLTGMTMMLSVVVVVLSSAGICPDLLVAADGFLLEALVWLLTEISLM